MYIVIFIIAGMFFLGVGLWVVLLRYYSLLLNDVRNSTFSTPLTKQIVLKYSNCIKLDISIKDVSVFVEKIIGNFRIGTLRFDEVKRICKVIEYAVAMTGVLGAFFLRDRIDAMRVCLTTGILCCIALHIIEKITASKEYTRRIVVETVDYLVNTGAHKYTASEQYHQKLTRYSAGQFDKLNKNYNRIQSAASRAMSCLKSDKMEMKRQSALSENKKASKKKESINNDNIMEFCSKDQKKQKDIGVISDVLNEYID